MTDDTPPDTDCSVVEGDVVATRTVAHQPSEFRRATHNSLEFRNLEGGTYTLVKVSDTTDTADEDTVDTEPDRQGSDSTP